MLQFRKAFSYLFQEKLGLFKQEAVMSSGTMFEQQQQVFENRISCGICLEPRLRMVTGKCQHRFCVSCTYNDNGTRRAGLERCPSCQQDGAFPATKPVIPEDLIEIQRALGVRACEQCGEEMWFRELIDHQRTCAVSPPVPNETARCRATQSSRKRSGRVEKRPQHKKTSLEAKMLLDDLGSRVSTRSRGSPQFVEVLDSCGAPKRKQRLAKKSSPTSRSKKK